MRRPYTFRLQLFPFRGHGPNVLSCCASNKKPGKCNTRHQTSPASDATTEIFTRLRREDNDAVAWKKYDKFVSHSFALIRCSTFYLCFVFGFRLSTQWWLWLGDDDDAKRMARKGVRTIGLCSRRRRQTQMFRVWKIPFRKWFSIPVHRAERYRIRCKRDIRFCGAWISRCVLCAGNKAKNGVE